MLLLWPILVIPPPAPSLFGPIGFKEESSPGTLGALMVVKGIGLLGTIGDHTLFMYRRDYNWTGVLKI